MAKDQSWIADLLAGYRTVQINGVSAAQEGTLDLKSGAGVTLAILDDPTNGITHVTISAVDEGSSVTGTGLWHSTSGTLDSAAVHGSAGQIMVSTGTDMVPTTVTGDGTFDGTGRLTLAALISGGSFGSASQTLEITVDTKGRVTALTPVTIAAPLGNATGTLSLTQLAQGGASTGNVLEWNGSDWAPAALPATSVTGTGLWYSASGTLNAAAVGVSGDLTLGAISGGNIPLTLVASGVTAGTYGDGTHVGQFVVDGKGRITSATAVAITGAAPTGTAGGDLSGTYPNPTVAGLKGVALPALSAGLLQYTGSVFAWTSSATVALGGTGRATLTAHGVLIGEGTSSINITAAGTAGQPLLSGGSSADPAFGTMAPGAITNGSEGQVIVAGASSPAWTTPSGDISWSATSPGATKLVSISAGTAVPLSSGTSITSTASVPASIDLSASSTGSIKAGTSGFLGPSLDVASAGTLSIGATNATTTAITGSSNITFNIGATQYFKCQGSNLFVDGGISIQSLSGPLTLAGTTSISELVSNSYQDTQVTIPSGGGTVTLTSTQQTSPVLTLSNGSGGTVTLAGNVTLDFGTTGGTLGTSASITHIDVSLITLGSFTLSVKDGSSSADLTHIINSAGTGESSPYKGLVVVKRNANQIVAG